jgi:hypothetical protein
MMFTLSDIKVYFQHLDLLLLHKVLLYTWSLLSPTHFIKSKFISGTHFVCMGLFIYNLKWQEMLQGMQGWQFISSSRKCGELMVKLLWAHHETTMSPPQKCCEPTRKMWWAHRKSVVSPQGKRGEPTRKVRWAHWGSVVSSLQKCWWAHHKTVLSPPQNCRELTG